MLSEKQVEIVDHNTNLSFEQALAEATRIVDLFQTGEMKLSHAAECYRHCRALLDHCAKKLECFETAKAINIDYNNVDFEQNLLLLHELKASTNNATLEQLIAVKIRWDELYQQCVYVLQQFHTQVIES